MKKQEPCLCTLGLCLCTFHLFFFYEDHTTGRQGVFHISPICPKGTCYSGDITQTQSKDSQNDPGCSSKKAGFKFLYFFKTKLQIPSTWLVLNEEYISPDCYPMLPAKLICTSCFTMNAVLNISLHYSTTAYMHCFPAFY